MPGSRLGRLIVFLNLLSLAILVVGALVVNEQRQALVDARKESLTVQGEFLAELMAQFATYEDPSEGFDQFRAARSCSAASSSRPSGRGCSTCAAR